MTSPKQAAANRRNAKNSTGPKTPEGKAGSRLNGLRHGLRAATVVLPNEDQKEFDQLCAELEADWKPQSRSERLLVEQMALAQWKLVRVQRAQSRILLEDPDGLEKLTALDRLYQMEVRLERSSFRAYKELDLIARRRRKAETASHGPEEKKNEEQGPRIVPGLIWVDPETGEETEVAPPDLVYPDGHREVMPRDDPRRAGLKRFPNLKQ